ncbi:hypothetical protein [Ligilactobacillus equi]|uniref:Cls2 protein n=1 Tax=Ligilactobacillus equi DPC 6820 TaxID=1392007 RepID=V7HTF1_9LACO|nr:hypothetical protein [Ligilactobacillus equi]ETA73484.1 cls2 protein [Ligilactobacillus equi DPC 6820]
MKLTTDVELYAYQEGYKEAARYSEKELRDFKDWVDGGKYYELELEDIQDLLGSLIDSAADYAKNGPESMQTELTFEEDGKPEDICEFCSFNGAPLLDDYGLTIYVDDAEKWLYVDKTEDTDKCIKINYCPMCGKELGND